MKNLIRPFFFSSKSDKIKPPYFWATLLLLLTVISICFVIFGERSDIIPLVGIMTGLVVGLMAIYNQGSKNNG